ncbi:response regulator [Actinoplanes sichuanensis]|nr:response regulator [Actinoplanes sichuanensis]
MTVLLVAEDDEDIAALLLRMFRKTTFTVSRAVDGVDALRAIRESPPDVLLTDIGMPRMDGWALIHEVRADERSAEIPIAVISGQLHPGDPRAAEYGVCALLTKPCPNEQVLNAIEQLAALGRHPHSVATIACRGLHLIPA